MVRHVIEWAFACENRSVTQRLRPQPLLLRAVSCKNHPIARQSFPRPQLRKPYPARAVPLPAGYVPNPPLSSAMSRESRPVARRLRPPTPPLRAVPCENRPITQQLQPRTWSSGAAPRENRSVTLQPCPKHHIWSCGRREPAYCPKNQSLRMIPARIRCISSADESIPGPKTVYDKLGCIRTNGRGTPAWQSLLTRPVRFTASS